MEQNRLITLDKDLTKSGGELEILGDVLTLTFYNTAKCHYFEQNYKQRLIALKEDYRIKFVVNY